jgi:putative ABC transport system permease protein
MTERKRVSREIWRPISLWLQALLHRGKVENELDAELRYDLERRMEANVRAGMTQEGARRAALREFGGVELAKEESRDTRGTMFLEQLWQDILFGLRILRKSPGFTAVAILTLALGIGSSTVVFSVVYNGLLNPFPYKDASRLMIFVLHDSRDANVSESGPDARGGLTPDVFVRFQENNTAFEDIIGFMNTELFCGNGQVTLNLHAGYVTSNTFQFLGVPPFLGRAIIPEDAKPSAPPVFAMNYRVWQRHFNADPNVVGTSFEIGGISRILVAVMPPRFQIDDDDIWIPSNPDPSDSGISTNAAEPNRIWWPLGRLKPGLSAEAGAADLTLLAQQFAKTFPSNVPAQFTTVITRPYLDLVVGNFRNMLYALAAAVAMLLLITCTNVANLLLSRGTKREKEIAIRASLGASRARLIRQFLAESLALSVAGAGMGCLFAFWGLKGILIVLPSGTLPKEAAIRLNPSVLLFSLGVTVLTALLCGLVVALYGTRGELNLRLTVAAQGTGTNAQGAKLRGGLVIAEVALSTVLLIAAGLMMRTLFSLTHVDLGFSPSNILVTELSFPNGAYSKPAAKRAFLQQVLKRVDASPGVVAAATTISLPPYGGPASDIDIPGRSHSERWEVGIDLCSSGFFQTLGMHLIQGRLFTESDLAASTERVVVVDEILARRFFPDDNAVGQNIKFRVLDLIPDAPHNIYFKIIGVVNSIKNDGLRRPAGPQAYLPNTTFATPGGNILVRSAENPLSLATEVQHAIGSVDRSVALADTRSLESYLQGFSYASSEFGLATFGSFASIGLILVAVGIFGVMAFAISIRTHEIGIRMALGAPKKSILRMILIEGSGFIAAGIIIGLLGSYWLTRFLASQLWNVSATDPSTFAGVAALALLAGLAACYLPARRATRVDPMTALRHE